MQFDLQFFKNNTLIGCDEVGRGPLAGPVVAAAVSLSEHRALEFLNELGINDSKKLSEKKRKQIISQLGVAQLESQKIMNLPFGIRAIITEVSEQIIDEINILQASLLAMQTAASNLLTGQTTVLIDGNKTFPIAASAQAVVKGDSKSLVIGLASILAKQFRDEKMRQLDALYPGYGLANHAGYPTAQHRQAISELGITPIHRKSFKGVKEFL